jgi:SAM-dependent methyltransferase
MPLRRDTLVAAQYFTAIAGAAAMRHCVTHPSSVRGRLDDVRRVIEHLDEFPNNLEFTVVEYGVDEGYATWAPAYGGQSNPAVDLSRALVADLLDGAPSGVALDAACGTGCHAATLAALGYEVIGVDASAAMLDVARNEVPGASFREGDLHSLPLEDSSVDVITCSLALTHVPELAPVLSEMARVLRPGGWVALVDIHPGAVTFGGAALFPTGESGPQLAYVPNLLHPVAEYVAAALAAGLTIADCREAPLPEDGITSNPAYPVLPDAVRQFYEGLPFILAWRLTKPA